MRRLCGRPGCSAPAAVTFTFDAARRIVWLDTISDGAARASDLCTRHADALAPPQGWTRDDRRPVVVVDPPEAAPSRGALREAEDLLPHRETKKRRRRADRWSDVPSLFDTPAPAPPSGSTPDLEAVPPLVEATDAGPAGSQLVEPELVEPQLVETEAVDTDARPAEPAWEARFDVDDLGGLLDAKTPLLSRAFRAAKTAEDDSDSEATPDPDHSRP